MATTQSASGLLDSTITALSGGLAGAAGAAGDNISSWLDLLQDNPQLTNITTELENLQDALSSGGSEVGSSLRKLGQLTTEAAASATPDTQDKLMQLGQTLSSAAAQL